MSLNIYGIYVVSRLYSKRSQHPAISSSSSSCKIKSIHSMLNLLLVSAYMNWIYTHGGTEKDERESKNQIKLHAKKNNKISMENKVNKCHW